MKKYTFFCITVACIFFMPLLCMDKLEEKDIAWLPSSPVAQALSFLLTEKLDLFQHDMICSLGITRECEKVLMENAGKIRQRFMKQIRHYKEYEDGKETVWHKYGSGWGKKKLWVSDEDNLERCTIYRAYFQPSTKLLMGHSTIEKFSQEISGFESPKFNEKGKLCYYYLRKFNENNSGIRVLALSTIRHTSTISSYNLLVSKDSFCETYVDLSSLLSFPMLLKSLLIACSQSNERYHKVCDLSTAIIPDDYKKCIPHDQSPYKSYAELPEFWREMIENRYAAQQKK